MGNKRTILFFLCGIAVCIAILLAGRNKRRFLIRPDKNASNLIENLAEDVDVITIERPGSRMEIQRIESRWRMVAPIDARIDYSKIKRLLQSFDSAVISDTLELEEINERGLSLADYGLYPARARITFQTAKKPNFFLFGNCTADQASVYLRKNDRNQIFVVPLDLYETIPQSADVLRSHLLVDGDPTIVNAVDIRRPGHPFIRLTLKDGNWMIEEPVSTGASQERVADFFELLYKIRINRFVWPSLDNVMDVAEYDKALKLRKMLYGLDETTGTSISIRTLDGSYDDTLVIGQKPEIGSDSVYALLDNGRAIGTVSNSFAELININPEYFRNMHVFDALPGAIDRLQIMLNQEVFVLSRTNDLWRIELPAAEPADQQIVRRAVDSIRTMKAERIVGRHRPDESWEQGRDNSYVELTTGAQIILGAVRPVDYEGLMYEFEFADRPELYYVAGSNVPPALIKREALLEFRDKTLLAVAKESISRVTIKKFGATALAVEFIEDDNSWHFAAGLNGRLNQSAFKRVLDFLAEFRADQVVKIGLKVDDAAYYGFAEPWLEITLDLNVEDAIRRSLLVGRAAGNNMRYVMVRGDQSVFLVEEQRLAVFAETLVEQDE